MGYRSEVAFKCSPDAHNVILGAAELVPELREMLLECENVEIYNGEFGNPDLEKDTPGAYYWSYTKWYEGFKCVDSMESIMSMLEDMGFEEHFGFIRLGEEYDDYEMRGDPSNFDMYINRSIEL